MKKNFMSKKVLAAITAGIIASSIVSVAPVSAAEQILNSSFEYGQDGWTNIGNCNIMQANWTKNSGNSCLYVGNRQANWSGALYNLSGKVKSGDTLKVSAYFMSWNINYDQDVQLTFSYRDNVGNTKYVSVAKKTAGSGQWTNMDGTFTVPENCNQPVIYFETSKNGCDLYLDDISIIKLSEGNTGSEPSNPNPGPVDPTPNPNPNPEPNPKPEGSMPQIADEYMKNIKIDIDCPSSASSRRNDVAYGSFVHKTYYSNTTKCNRGFNIALPANYNPQKKYPVLYVLHGIFGDENSLVGNGFETIAANLAADGAAKEMIIVLPNMYAAPQGSQPSFTQEGIAGYDNFINELKNSLMPYIEKNYSVATGRENTAIAGFSMGGRETLYIGLTSSDIFGYVGAVAPAPGATPAQDWAMYHPGQLQESEFKIANPDNTPYCIMLCAGTNDSVVGKFPENYHNILTRNGQNHIWYTIPGADHDNRAINSCLHNFIRAIFHAN